MEDEWSMEIAYESELNTEENPELLELAREEVHEDPDTRSAAIEELRALIYERGECSPRRLGDAFLLRFLRARKYDVRRAYKLLIRYSRFLDQYPDLYSGVDLFGLVRVGRAFEGTIYDHPSCGRISIMRFGFWELNDVPIEDLVRAGLAMTEIGLRQPKMQVIGGTLIVDLENITVRHVATLTPTVVYQIICLTGLAIPLRVKSIHFVNYSWIINTFLYMFQRYMGPSIRKRTYFHGYDHESLRKHIHPACLPVRYGGTCTAYHNHFGFWLNKIKQYRDESFDQEMKEFGYIIKE
ncbi:hypothetical protein MSG28_012491 [Choristoneura fumiferana]|uniref:Uncharacterized protein n=1 Tax=Choristoneura fumiferana TaxID=7141 RepID=A0ACC0KDE2_CHOFU|nr:hypothetical protein MSG28_012491 [Choristoneura fumiferana]